MFYVKFCSRFYITIPPRLRVFLLSPSSFVVVVSSLVNIITQNNLHSYFRCSHHASRCLLQGDTLAFHAFGAIMLQTKRHPVRITTTTTTSTAMFAPYSIYYYFSSHHPHHMHANTYKNCWKITLPCLLGITKASNFSFVSWDASTSCVTSSLVNKYKQRYQEMFMVTGYRVLKNEQVREKKYIRKKW